MSNWKQRHNQATAAPRSIEERRVTNMYRLLCSMVNQYGACSFSVPNILGPMFQAARAQLNHEVGRIDRGEMDKIYLRLAESVGWHVDNQDWLESGESNF